MSTVSPERAPCLVADVGGTNARFALQSGSGQISEVRVYRCNDFATLADAVAAYLRDTQGRSAGVRHAAVAIAYPVDGDEVRMTNHPWQFSIEATRRVLGLETLLMVNDFAALAMAVPTLSGNGLAQVGGGVANPGAVIGVLGAGTGLGVSALVPMPDGHWHAIASEGGHSSFAPVDTDEDYLLTYARERWQHVSFERLCSGPGLELIHEALAARAGISVFAAASPGRTAPDAPAITDRARANDPLAQETVAMFCAILGTFAGNIAVTFGARGGIYIGGGVVPKLGELFLRSPFRARFESKGRFVTYLQHIPTFVIIDEYPAFAGAAALLAEALQRGGARP